MAPYFILCFGRSFPRKVIFNHCLVKHGVLRSCSTSRISVKEVFLLQPVGKRIRVKGWVQAYRKQKDNVFIDLSDGSSLQRLQIILKSSETPRQLSYGCSIDVEGELVKSTHPKQPVELHPDIFKLCGNCNVEEFPFPPRGSLDPNYTRKFPHLRSRTKTFSSFLRVRSELNFAIHDFFKKEGFVFINTPIITSNDCEGAGEAFVVQAPTYDSHVNSNPASPDSTTEVNFFDKRVFLTVSGQLHLEAMASSLTNVYTLGPTFRAENSRTRHHLSEFYMLEAEMAFLDNLENLMAFVENLIKCVTKSLLDACPQDVAWLHKQAEPKVDLSNLLDKDFIRITYTEAVAIIEKLNTTENLKWGQDLQKVHEKELVHHFGDVPVFLTNFPAKLKPFYMKTSEHDTALVDAMDLLVPGVGELCGGSVREHRYGILRNRLEEMNLVDSLTWYLNLRKFGSCPHAGFGLGFERYLQYILGITNIKDCIPFPRWPHHCQL